MLDQVPDPKLKLKQGPEDLRAYFRNEFREMLDRPDIDECIYAHLVPRFAAQLTLRISQLMTNLIDE